MTLIERCEAAQLRVVGPTIDGGVMVAHAINVKALAPTETWARLCPSGPNHTIVYER